MSKKLVLRKHLSQQELLSRYRNADNVTLKSHYQIIWLLSTSKTPKQVAEITGYSQTWIYQLMNRYNQQAEKGLGDLRTFNRGKKPLLNDVQQAQLHQVLTSPAPDGGLWGSNRKKLV